MDLELSIWIGIGVAVAAFLVLLAIFLAKRRKKTPPVSSAPLTLALAKTRQGIFSRLQTSLGGNVRVDDSLLSQLEESLISADVGVKTTQKLLEGMREDAEATGLGELHLLKEYLGKEVCKILRPSADQWEPAEKPHVIMVVGVNGVGKTTTIAKLAHHYKEEGNQVLLAAADTFRAGAVDQIRHWGDRIGVTTLSQKEGADPAAVAFDAVKAGIARGTDRVVIDTAGRLHTKVNLMEELKKVKRVIAKAMAGAPHEILLVIDATQGQNALHQARQFHEALGLTGIVLTKLDSTSKGGIVVGIVDELKVPVQYLGVGEKLEDLRLFKPREFVDALIA